MSPAATMGSFPVPSALAELADRLGDQALPVFRRRVAELPGRHPAVGLRARSRQCRLTYVWEPRNPRSCQVAGLHARGLRPSRRCPDEPWRAFSTTTGTRARVPLSQILAPCWRTPATDPSVKRRAALLVLATLSGGTRAWSCCCRRRGRVAACAPVKLTLLGRERQRPAFRNFSCPGCLGRRAGSQRHRRLQGSRGLPGAAAFRLPIWPQIVPEHVLDSLLPTTRAPERLRGTNVTDADLAPPLGGLPEYLSEASSSAASAAAATPPMRR
jgi:hypothetical protein